MGSASTPARENQPPVKRGGALMAPTAGLYAESGCDSLDHITKSDVLIIDEPRKPHAVRLRLILVLLLGHCCYLFMFWYAAQAFSSGGTIDLRCTT
jgi:hypothetical protein